MLVTDLKNDRAESLVLIKMVGLIIAMYFVDDGRLRARVRKISPNSLQLHYQPVL